MEFQREMIGDRPIEERSKAEIERKLKDMGDYVKMSYLQRALKSKLDFDARRFVLLRLGGIYESRKMFQEAAKCVRAAADITTTFREKIRDFMKAVGLYVKGGNFHEAEILFGQCLALGNSREKEEMKANYKEFYKTQARMFVEQDKRANAADVYEKMLRMDLDDIEKQDVKGKLLGLYERLGRVKEFYQLKERMD